MWRRLGECQIADGCLTTAVDLGHQLIVERSVHGSPLGALTSRPAKLQAARRDWSR